MKAEINFRRNILLFIVSTLLCISYSTAAQSAEKTSVQSLKHLETLTEDMIDHAAGRDSAAVTISLKELKNWVSTLESNGQIGAEKAKELRNRIGKMAELWHTKKVDKFIVEDNCLFLEFIDLLYKSGTQDIPWDVVYLDYLARELQYRPKIKGWKATERAVREVKNTWQSLSKGIKTKALSDLVENTIARLPEVLRQRDGEQLYFIGQLILDEVDLLEDNFKKP